MTVTNASGTFQNNPYITVTVGNMAPSAYASVSIQFMNPSNGSINYAPITYSGGLPT